MKLSLAAIILATCTMVAPALLAKVPLPDGVTTTKEWTAETLPGDAILVTPKTDAYALILDRELKDKSRLLGLTLSKVPYIAALFELGTLASLVAHVPTKPQLRKSDFVITYKSQTLVFSPGGDGKPSGPLVPSGKPSHLAFGCRDGKLTLLFGTKEGMPKPALKTAATLVKDYRCSK